MLKFLAKILHNEQNLEYNFQQQLSQFLSQHLQNLLN